MGAGSYRMDVDQREAKESEGSWLRCLGCRGENKGVKAGAEAKTREAAGSGLDRTGSPPPPSYFLPRPCIASAVIISLAALGGRNVTRCECFGRRRGRGVSARGEMRGGSGWGLRTQRWSLGSKNVSLPKKDMRKNS